MTISGRGSLGDIYITANRKRATCTASGEEGERRREGEMGFLYSITLNWTRAMRCVLLTTFDVDSNLLLAFTTIQGALFVRSILSILAHSIL